MHIQAHELIFKERNLDETELNAMKGHCISIHGSLLRTLAFFFA